MLRIFRVDLSNLIFTRLEQKNICKKCLYDMLCVDVFHKMKISNDIDNKGVLFYSYITSFQLVEILFLMQRKSLKYLK